MASNQIVIIGEFDETTDSLKELLESSGICAITARSVQEWLETNQPPEHACVVLVSELGDFSQADWLAQFHALCADHLVLVLADVGDVPAAVEAIRHGAIDVAQKSIGQGPLLERVRELLSRGLANNLQNA